jgi:uncharacterized membrane protein
MIGSFIIMGKGWGTIRTGGHFVSFWRLIAFTFVELAVITFIPDLVTPLVQNTLFTYSNYITGITSALVGTFIAWFVYSFEYNYRTQYKWAVIGCCYLITIANIMFYHCVVLGTTC